MNTKKGRKGARFDATVRRACRIAEISRADASDVLIMANWIKGFADDTGNPGELFLLWDTLGAVERDPVAQLVYEIAGAMFRFNTQPKAE